MKNRKRSAESGFTLIELLVVVLIIGILASIALPQYFIAVEKGRSAEAQNFIDTLKSPEQEYIARYGYACGFTLAQNTPMQTVMCANGSLAFNPPILKYFTCSVNAGTDAAGNPSFMATCTRQANPTPPSNLAGYQIIFNPANASSPMSCNMPACYSFVAGIGS